MLEDEERAKLTLMQQLATLEKDRVGKKKAKKLADLKKHQRVTDKEEKIGEEKRQRAVKKSLTIKAQREKARSEGKFGNRRK